MAKLTADREVAGRRVQFQWHGGAYVTVFVGGRAVEVINVWNDGAGRSKIDATAEALGTCVDGWLADGAFAADLLAGNYGRY